MGGFTSKTSLTFGYPLEMQAFQAKEVLPFRAGGPGGRTLKADVHTPLFLLSYDYRREVWEVWGGQWK